MVARRAAASGLLALEASAQGKRRKAATLDASNRHSATNAVELQLLFVGERLGAPEGCAPVAYQAKCRGQGIKGAKGKNK